MNLHDFNTMDPSLLREKLKTCCGSDTWVTRVMQQIPAEDLVDLLEIAEECWYTCTEDDWLEAFAAHPEIGNLESLNKKYNNTAAWASEEQGSVNAASKETIAALAEANRLYKEKFGFIFIVCATGKTAEEMLGLLHTRLQNAPIKEMRIAADEQNKITRLRLEKLLE